MFRNLCLVIITSSALVGCHQGKVSAHHNHSEQESSHHKSGAHVHAAHNHQHNHQNKYHDEEKSDAKAETHPSHTKPSAPISMRHNLSGPIEINQEHSFDIDIIAQKAGEISLKISAEQDILLGGQIDLSKEVQQGESIQFPVSVLALEEGKYYLQVAASMSYEGKSHSRPFSIAIKTSGYQPQSVQSSSNKVQGDGQNIKSSEAKQTHIRLP